MNLDDSFELPAIDLDATTDPEYHDETVEELVARANSMIATVTSRLKATQPSAPTVVVRATSEMEAAINNTIEIPSTPDEDDVIFVGTQHNTAALNNSIIDLCSPDKGPCSSRFTAVAVAKSGPRVDEDSGPKENMVKCSICLDSSVGRKPHSTNCGHIFCGDCIKASIKIHKKCPMCNKPLNLKNIFPIYI